MQITLVQIKKLCEISGISFNSFKKLKRTKLKHCGCGTPRYPPLNSKKLAEFCGILLGDGCIYTHNKTVCISGHKVYDRPFLEIHVAKLIYELFGLRPVFYYRKNRNALDCIVHCKKIGDFLSKYLPVVGNKKLVKATIPKYYFQNKELLKACLRGLCDTDGSFCPHPHTKVMFNLTIKNPHLFRSAKKAFAKVGFPIRSSDPSLYFYGEKFVDLFLREIGSSNPKHLIKLHIFRETGIMPRSSFLDVVFGRDGPGEIRTLDFHLS